MDVDRKRLEGTKRIKIRLAWGLLAGSAANAALFFATGGTSLLVIAVLFGGLAVLNFRAGGSK